MIIKSNPLFIYVYYYGQNPMQTLTGSIKINNLHDDINFTVAKMKISYHFWTF